MKRHLIFGSLPAVLMAMLVSSCIDDNYDLSDIDTTTRIDVTDLTIPVNIDPVTLGDIIKFDENSKIQPITIDGKEFYALSQDGDFHSEPIQIAAIRAKSTPIADTNETLSRIFTSSYKGKRLPEAQISYELHNIGNDFSYTATSIDPAIVSLAGIKTAPFKFGLILEISDPQSVIGTLTFTDLVIRMPKGLMATTSVGTYDRASGLWKINKVEVARNVVPVSLTATGIDMKLAGASINPDHSLDFNSEFRIQEGLATVSLTGVPTGMDNVNLNVKYEIGDLEVQAFSGRIQYQLEGLDIAPVSLSDIPDFLRGGDTNIELANPQIYLGVNNPLADVPLNCSTGLQLTAMRNGMPTLTFTPEQIISIGHDKGVSGPYNFVLTPEGDHLTVPADFSAGLQRVNFNTLGSLLATPASWSTHGLPDQIGIALLNPQVPVQDVVDFTLPRTISGVNGHYRLLAPLALNDGSHVIYTETRTGWSTEDLEDLTVTALTLTADVDNQCPAGAQIYVYPIDVDGKEIDGVEIKSNRLEAGQSSQLVITMTGEVRRLDGIRIVAVLEGHDGSALAPSQRLVLSNIKAKVSGYYQREL